MRKTLYFISFFFIFLTAGCATTAKYEAVLDSWMGHDINELINSWGYPDGSFDHPNGNKVYAYSSSGSYIMPTTYNTQSTYTGVGNTIYGNSYITGYGGQTLNFWCKTFFEVNSSNKIVNWRWEGNNCTRKLRRYNTYQPPGAQE